MPRSAPVLPSPSFRVSRLLTSAGVYVAWPPTLGPAAAVVAVVPLALLLPLLPHAASTISATTGSARMLAKRRLCVPLMDPPRLLLGNCRPYRQACQTIGWSTPVASAAATRGKWQATNRSAAPSTGRMIGSSSAHRSWARGQRVRKRQPDGGAVGDGSSPASSVRSRLAESGSGIGIDDSRAAV